MGRYPLQNLQVWTLQILTGSFATGNPGWFALYGTNLNDEEDIFSESGPS